MKNNLQIHVFNFFLKLIYVTLRLRNVMFNLRKKLNAIFLLKYSVLVIEFTSYLGLEMAPSVKKQSANEQAKIENGLRAAEAKQKRIDGDLSCCETIRIKAVEGVAKDGQFWITATMRHSDGTEYYHGNITTRYEKNLHEVVNKNPRHEGGILRIVVPARFLKDAGTKKAKLNCPDLIKVGATVFVKAAVGVQMHKHDIGYGGWKMVNDSYADIDFLLTDEEDKEWRSLDLLEN